MVVCGATLHVRLWVSSVRTGVFPFFVPCGPTVPGFWTQGNTRVLLYPVVLVWHSTCAHVCRGGGALHTDRCVRLPFLASKSGCLAC